MIRIDTLDPDDLEIVSCWLSRPEVTRWLNSEWRDNQAGARRVAVAVRNKTNRFWMVRCNADRCGLVGLSEIDSGDHTANLWYLLGDPAFGGRGVMTEAVRLVLQTAFRDLGLASIYAWVMSDNSPSLRVLEKAGFQYAGRIRLGSCSAGRQVDRLFFDTLQEDARPDSRVAEE